MDAREEEQNAYVEWFRTLTPERQQQVRALIKVLLATHGGIKWSCLTAKALLEPKWSK